MMYGGSDAAVDLGPPSRRASRPRDDLRVPGMERRRRSRLDGRVLPRRLARRESLCAVGPRGVLRLPGQPPVCTIRRWGKARVPLAVGGTSRVIVAAGAGGARDYAGRGAI